MITLQKIDQNDRPQDIELKVNEAVQALEDNLNEYDELIGILSQSGTDDPVLTILKNDFDEIPTMGRTSAGLCTMTTVADVFTADKTTWSGFAPGDATADKAMGVVRTSAKVLTISQAIATVAADVFGDTPIEIRVYD
jgi:hypothetical protein